jgi:lysozyme family protein
MSVRRYVAQIPQAVTADFVATAKGPLTRAQPLYQDVASRTGIPWKLLAACDWMQCQAQPRYSPVHGEKLGTANPDGTVFRTKSAALAQCASDLVELADAVYLIDLTVRRALSVRELANTFAAFRWGGLLQVHGISAMEFPYSVLGLTSQYLKMRWPDINDPRAPDKPGTRFRMPFGAVPVVLSLGYRAVA